MPRRLNKYEYFGNGILYLNIGLTSDDSRHGIWNDRPKLHLVGVFGKIQVFDDCRQLGLLDRVLTTWKELTYKESKGVQSG